MDNKCSICYDDGFFGSDIYDCVEYLEVKEGKPKGSWMVDWYKNIKKNEAEQPPYESDFVKWSKHFK